MDATVDTESELSETPEEIRNRVRVEFRIYLIVVAIVSLIIGGIMGKYLFGEVQPDIRVESNQPVRMLSQDAAEIPLTHMDGVIMSVYVSGAVDTSKVVTLAQGSLVVDAIEAAGGASDNANLDAINLAAPVRDHEHIYVPQLTEERAIQTSKVLLNINTATVTELEVLPNIGPTRAQQIVAYRESHGPFLNKEDIMLVSGIGQTIYEELAPFIFVSGE
jgi:competence protein ComEA